MITKKNLLIFACFSPISLKQANHVISLRNPAKNIPLFDLVKFPTFKQYMTEALKQEAFAKYPSHAPDINVFDSFCI